MKLYGYCDNGERIFIPAGWRLLLEGEVVPDHYMEYCDSWLGYTGWMYPKTTTSPAQTNIGVSGSIRAIAVRSSLGYS